MPATTIAAAPLTITESEILKLTGLARSTWRLFVARGDAPAPLADWPGRCRTYSRRTFLAWLAERGVRIEFEQGDHDGKASPPAAVG